MECHKFSESNFWEQRESYFLLVDSSSDPAVCNHQCNMPFRRLEVTVEPWIDSLWPVLRQALGLPPEESGVIANGTDLDSIVNECSSDDRFCKGTSLPNGDVPSLAVAGKLGDGVANTETPSFTEVTSMKNALSGSAQPETVQNRTSNVTRDSKKEPEEMWLHKKEAESLTCSVPPLSESSLTLPVCPAPFLDIEFHPGEELVGTSVHQFKHRKKSGSYIRSRDD